MNRKQLEHVLRACGSIAGCREIVVIGSQALLASSPDAPDALLRSLERTPRCRLGLLAHTGGATASLGERLWAIPIPALLS